MPANIATYIGRASAWHNLGTVTGHFMTWEEIQSNGGLDYTVFKSQLRDGLGRPVEAWGTFRWNVADKAAGNKDAARFLGVVGSDYTPIQHAEGFKLMDALVASQDGAHYETAGALGNGERVWGLADLRMGFSLGADEHKTFLLFCTGHDGSMSHMYRLVNTRVVCQNTLTAALGERTASRLKVRHTRNAQTRIDGMHETLASLAGDVATVREKMEFLMSRRVVRESLDAIMGRLFPVKVDQETGEERPTTRRENIVADILALYERADGGAFPEQRGTAYNLLNAVTEYADHSRTARTDGGSVLKARAESALFGTGDLLKRNALAAILEEAEGMPPAGRGPSIQVDFSDLGLNVPALATV